jgi:hypothetical protein
MGSGHLIETVGYIAIHPPENNDSLPLSSQLLPFSVAKIRINTQPTTLYGQTFFLQEEQSADEEMHHFVNESVFILSWDELLFGQIASDNGLDTINLRRN